MLSSADSYVGPAYLAEVGPSGQLTLSVDRCEQVSLDGRRCWRTKHVDWCCGFDGPPIFVDWRKVDSDELDH